jgi:hypothetical protein
MEPFADKASPEEIEKAKKRGDQITKELLQKRKS